MLWLAPTWPPYANYDPGLPVQRPFGNSCTTNYKPKGAPYVRDCERYFCGPAVSYKKVICLIPARVVLPGTNIFLKAGRIREQHFQQLFSWHHHHGGRT